MIRDLIFKLQEEATAETEHKGWCDAELGTNKLTREEKTASVEALQATVEQLKANIAQTTMKVTELSAAVVELDKTVKEAVEQRSADHEKNTATIADAKAAQSAVAQALATLKEFYAKAGEATALVQTGSKAKKQSPLEDGPEIFDTGYKGMQDVKGGVVGMLEVIQSDFVRLEADTTQSEAEDDAAHERLLNDSEVDKAVKQTDIEHLGRKKVSLTSDLNTAKRDLTNTQKELDAAMQYFAKLKPSCIDTGVTYEDRV